LVELRTFNPQVLGSSPSGGTTSRAQAAGALNHLTIDLPVERISRRDPHRRAARLAAARRRVQIHLIGYLAMSALTIGIWPAIAVAAGAWYYWPVWPILGGGIGVISHAIPVRRYARKRHNLGLRRAFR
jgi:hypothetical protein